jgi:hypothetical protein
MQRYVFATRVLHDLAGHLKPKPEPPLQKDPTGWLPGARGIHGRYPSMLVSPLAETLWNQNRDGDSEEMGTLT